MTGALTALLVLAQAVAAPPADGTLLATGEPLPGAPDGVVVRSIDYASDGLRVKGYLARPRAEGTYPALIFNRGGNREFGALTDAGAARRLGLYASWGYVVVASQYRGNGGGEGREEFGGADVNDVLNLFPLLDGMSEVDRERVGMIGWSRGGMMTYLALARTDRIRAAAVGAGLADLEASLRLRPELEPVARDLIPRFDTEREGQLAARSAVRWAGRLPAATPILLLHGTADWRVDPRQALAMASALLEAKRPYRLTLFEGGDHALGEFRDDVDRAIREWMDRYVRDRKPFPSLEPHGD